MEIEACIQAFLQNISPIEKTETVHLLDSCGRIAAARVCAPQMVPAFPKSAMDGYAVRAEDTVGATKDKPVILKVIGELCAGDYKEFVYVQNTAVRIMTGAYVPEGFDAVIRQEDTDYGVEYVKIYKGVASYTNYCKVGEDIKQGDVVLEKGSRITPLHIGLLASLGIAYIDVFTPVKVAILSTGSELVNLDEPLGQTCKQAISQPLDQSLQQTLTQTPKQPLEWGKIYNSIAYMLYAAISKEGFPVVFVETCPDNRERLLDSMKRALELADIVITTGGVSVGKKDLLPEVLDAIGAEKLFTRANIQPGTPTIGSVCDTKPILSLSGNPFAAFANFEIYFWELAAALMHNDSFRVRKGKAVLESDYPKVNHLRRFVRAYAFEQKRGVRVSIPSDIHSSSVISNMVQCNCFIDLEAGRKVSVGDVVDIWYFKGE